MFSVVKGFCLTLLCGGLIGMMSGCQSLDLARIVGRNIAYQLKNPVQPPAAKLTPPVRSNPGSSEIRAGWIGHSSIFLNFGGTFVLADPVFSKRIKIARRVVASPVEPSEIKSLDFILITHAHYDHLDIPSLEKLPREATLIIPQGCRVLVEDLGFSRVIELKWEESFSAGGLTIQAFRPTHWGRRTPWDEDRGYNSYILNKNGKSILLAGDTGYSKVFEEKGRGRDIVLSFFPITAYKPEWFRRNHANPEEALKMFLETGARYMIPIHWGTFILSHEPLGEPVARLKDEAKRLGIEDRVIVLRHGEWFSVSE